MAQASPRLSLRLINAAFEEAYREEEGACLPQYEDVRRHLHLGTAALLPAIGLVPIMAGMLLLNLSQWQTFIPASLICLYGSAGFLYEAHKNFRAAIAGIEGLCSAP